MSPRSPDERLLVELPGVTDRGELEVHYQPELELAGGAVLGMEALLRWAHPGRGLLWPGDFLAEAGVVGLLPSIGRWVLATVAGELRQWPGDRRCWVNVSAVELADPAFPDVVAAVVTAAGLAPGALGVDLAEADLLAAGPAAVGVCARLRAAGVSLAADGVGAMPAGPRAAGSGGDGHGFLRALDLDAVKLSRTLVRGVEADADRRHEVDVLVRAAHAVGQLVIAEGVESWPEALRLADLGVDRAHGFLFSPPQRADRARWLLGRAGGWRGSYVGDGPRWAKAGRAESGIHDALPDHQVTPGRRVGLQVAPSRPQSALPSGLPWQRHHT